MIAPLRLKPEFKERVWGGNRLQPDNKHPVGEAWVIHEHCEILDGPFRGRTLAEVATEHPVELLGKEVVEATGARVPLLIKLLDAHDWLSVQVHPDDEHARLLEGPDEFGKTEAWYILESEDNARLVTGLIGTPDREAIRNAIESGTLERFLRYSHVAAGDVVFIPAGSVHAIGPGFLIYEVQQTSDITYRLFDWNRPAEDGRELHVDKGVQVISLVDAATISSPGGTPRVNCAYFTLDAIDVGREPVSIATHGNSFHAVTVVRGSVDFTCEEYRHQLGALESVFVPASAGTYQMRSENEAHVLISRVP